MPGVSSHSKPELMSTGLRRSRRSWRTRRLSWLRLRRRAAAGGGGGGAAEAKEEAKEEEKKEEEEEEDEDMGFSLFD